MTIHTASMERSSRPSTPLKRYMLPDTSTTRRRRLGFCWGLPSCGGTTEKPCEPENHPWMLFWGAHRDPRVPPQGRTISCRLSVAQGWPGRWRGLYFSKWNFRLGLVIGAIWERFSFQVWSFQGPTSSSKTASLRLLSLKIIIWKDINPNMSFSCHTLESVTLARLSYSGRPHQLYSYLLRCDLQIIFHKARQKCQIPKTRLCEMGSGKELREYVSAVSSVISKPSGFSSFPLLHYYSLLLFWALKAWEWHLTALERQVSIKMRNSSEFQFDFGLMPASLPN